MVPENRISSGNIDMQEMFSLFLMPLSLPETTVSIFFGVLPKRDKKFAAKKNIFFIV